jgi:hypothetical protein
VAAGVSRNTAPARLGSRPLRGRSAELDAVLAALRASRNDHGSVAVVRGEPGIGKTAFIKAVVERAGRLGFATAYSAARPQDRIAPLASLGPALRLGVTPLIDSGDFMDLASLHEQPLWLAERLATLLERRVRDGPVLLAVDDAQWCDPLTGFILRVLPKRLAGASIAWVLATRPAPGGPADLVIEAAQPDLPVLPVELSPLTDDAVFAIAVDRLGARPSAPVLSRLADARGNPFLAVQLLEGLFDPGGPGPGPGGAPASVPAGLIEGVRRRVAATSRLTRELVRTAAVLGPVFPLADVAQQLGVPAAQLTEPLTEAIMAGLLVDEGTVVRFPHDLLREAVYHDLPPSGRRALHQGFAAHLLATGRGYAAAAPHVLATAEPGDSAAADVLRRAAHEVLDTMATTSVTFITQAFELTGPADPARGEIGAEMVEILLRARHFDEALAFATMLLAAPATSAGLGARIRLLLLPRLWATGRRADLTELASPGPLPGAARVPPGLGDRLAGYRALAGGTTAGPAAAAPGTDQVAAVLATVAAAERAEREGDYVRTHELFASARAAAQHAAGYGLPEVGQLAVRELLALARRDDIDGALAGLEDKARFPDSWQAPQLALLRVQLTLGSGRLDDAARAVATAAALMAELRDATFVPDLRQLEAEVALLRGESAAARAMLVAAGQRGEDLPLIRALLADAQGDPRGAAELVALASELAWPARRIIGETPRRSARRRRRSPKRRGAIRACPVPPGRCCWLRRLPRTTTSQRWNGCGIARVRCWWPGPMRSWGGSGWTGATARRRSRPWTRRATGTRSWARSRRRRGCSGSFARPEPVGAAGNRYRRVPTLAGRR